MKTLVLMANSEWALFVQLEKNHFEVIEEREHPESKEKVGHLVSDRSGRASSKMSAVGPALNERQDVMDEERRKFAREVVGFCKQRCITDPFQELWIVAGPRFLGELRSYFQGMHALPYSIREIHKELTPYESVKDKMRKVQEWVHELPVRKKATWKFA
jgi:protein required for attachment to host cells